MSTEALVTAHRQAIIDAARKIKWANRYHPTHLGDCIGPLSGTTCGCGMSDLMWAVRHLDDAEDPRCPSLDPTTHFRCLLDRCHGTAHLTAKWQENGGER